MAKKSIQSALQGAYRGLSDRLKMPIWHRARFAKKFAERLANGLEYPVGVDIEINYRCNRAGICPYCPKKSNTDETMSDGTFRAIVDQLKEWKYSGRVSPNSYNEPLSDRRLFTLLEYARKQLPSAKIVLITNGDLLTDEKIGGLDEIGVDSIVLSIHEPCDTPSEMRFIEFARNHELVQIEEMRHGKRNYPLFNRCGAIDLGPTTPMPRCYAVDNMIIRVNGDVPMCFNDFRKEMVWGNIAERSVRDIWTSPAFTLARREVRRGVYKLDVCQRCGAENKINQFR